MSRTPDETALTELLHRMADYARTEPAHQFEPVVAEERRRRQPAWRASVAVAFAAIVAVAAASLFLDDGGAHRLDTSRPAGEAPSPATADPAGRHGAASVWTGTELIVWGGSLIDPADPGASVGVALDPVTNRWRALPPAPIPSREGAASVWTGTEMLVSGGVVNGTGATDGAAFDPRSNQWRPIAPQPFDGALRPAAVWTGTEMLVVSGQLPATTTAYNPATNQWRRLADPPGASLTPYPEVVWTGSEAIMILWPSAPLGPTSGPGTGPNSGMFVASYAPASDQWTRLPPLAMKDGTLPRIAWTGREVLILQSSLPGAALDLVRRTWRPLAPLPTPAVTPAPVAWTGRAALVWSGATEGFAYDPATDTWSPFNTGGQQAPGTIVAWADGLRVTWSP